MTANGNAVSVTLSRVFPSPPVEMCTSLGQKGRKRAARKKQEGERKKAGKQEE
jgi:hypothetical protein